MPVGFWSGGFSFPSTRGTRSGGIMFAVSLWGKRRGTASEAAACGLARKAGGVSPSSPKGRQQNLRRADPHTSARPLGWLRPVWTKFGHYGGNRVRARLFVRRVSVLAVQLQQMEGPTNGAQQMEFSKWSSVNGVQQPKSFFRSHNYCF